VEQAVSAYGLKSLPGSDGDVQILEDVKAMSKGYKDGTSLEFTATLNCAMDPERAIVTGATEEPAIEETQEE
jgi:hypothetical protein